jgi:mannose-6-phosphate isomerase class I
VDALLEPVLSISRPRADDENDPGQARCRWLLHADDLFSSAGHHDRGLLSFLLLNLLHLRPGQAIFLPAGQLHSYLAGAGLELMANSNNVLRGGLTSKHIDVDALLDVLHVDPRAPEILEPETLASNPDFGAPAGATPMRYDTPSAEFALERLRLPPHARHVLTPRSVVLGLVLGGTVEITGAAAGLRVGRGGCFLLPAGCTANMRATSGADVALATVPCMAGCADGD